MMPLTTASPHPPVRAPSSSSWGRSQKYHRRTRHFYALLFADRSCYVGQTIALKRRWAEHRRVWTAPFVPIELETMERTQADAEEHEYAWRFVAERRGFKVLGKPGVVVRARRRMTPARLSLARALAERRGRSRDE
jgi:predicted GIY-YIG superfamily endonuclease